MPGCPGAQSVILPFSQRRAISERYTNRTVVNCTPLAGAVSAASVGLPANDKASQPDFAGPGPDNFTTPDAGTCCGGARLLGGCTQGGCAAFEDIVLCWGGGMHDLPGFSCSSFCW